jgi:hypothetical protein
MAGHNKAGHYKLGFNVGPERATIVAPTAGQARVRRLARSGDGAPTKIVYRDSRCPGCHGQMTLKYARVRVGDSYKFHLLSPSPAHPVCAETLREIRRGNVET